MIIEYADYECPYCQKLAPTLDQLQAAYGAKVALAYKDMPLPMHSHSEKAAEAAHCAGAQGKFWEYHDLLFSRKELEVPELKEQARTLKLDAQKFDHCLDSGEQAALVSSQSTEGQGFQLQGTPSFFINGRFFPGVLSYEQLRTVIDEELAGAAGRNASRAQVN